MQKCESAVHAVTSADDGTSHEFVGLTGPVPPVPAPPFPTAPPFPMAPPFPVAPPLPGAPPFAPAEPPVCPPAIAAGAASSPLQPSIATAVAAAPNMEKEIRRMKPPKRWGTGRRRALETIPRVPRGYTTALPCQAG